MKTIYLGNYLFGLKFYLRKSENSCFVKGARYYLLLRQSFLNLTTDNNIYLTLLMFSIVFLYYIDIDECLYKALYCSYQSSCTNLNGSYLCTCLPGFTGDGQNCRGLLIC